MGCAKPLSVKETRTDLPATILTVEDDSFDEEAAAIGFLLGDGFNNMSQGVLWGASGGMLFAHGCDVTLQLPVGRIVKNVDSTQRCRTLRVGDATTVSLHHKVVDWPDPQQDDITDYYSW